jgi:hypothetical protein
MIVKGNQPQLQQDIHRVFQEPLARTEDRSQVRCGSIPQVMAACRNTAIGSLRGVGEPNIAGACRRCAAQPWTAFALSGIIPDN